MTRRDEDDPWSVDEREFPSSAPLAEKAEFLLRYAVLAASVRNSQPWRFAILENGEIEIQADPARWLQTADPAKRELMLSLGCALESLLVAVERFGLGHRVIYQPDPDLPDLAASVSLVASGRPAPFRSRELFPALTERRTDVGPYAPRPVPERLLERLRACRVERGVGLVLSNDTVLRRELDYLTGRADALLLSDPAFRAELDDFLRAGITSGAWLLTQTARVAAAARDLGAGAERRKAELLQGGQVVGLITAEDDDPVLALKAGQLFTRVALGAAALGLSVHPVSSALQVPHLTDQLRELLPVRSAMPLLFFRLGEALERAPRTPRRPVEEVLGPRLSQEPSEAR